MDENIVNLKEYSSKKNTENLKKSVSEHMQFLVDSYDIKTNKDLEDLAIISFMASLQLMYSAQNPETRNKDTSVKLSEFENIVHNYIIGLIEPKEEEGNEAELERSEDDSI